MDAGDATHESSAAAPMSVTLLIARHARQRAQPRWKDRPRCERRSEAGGSGRVSGARVRQSARRAGNSLSAREAIARVIFDVGLDPHDSGPLRFARVIDALSLVGQIPGQRRRAELYDLKRLPSTPWSCFFHAVAAFGYGKPYDLDSLPQVPQARCTDSLRGMAAAREILK